TRPQDVQNPQPLCCGETQSLAPLTAARAANGHATTVLLENLMNSRRLMASPAPRTKSGIKRLSHFWTENCAVRRTQAGPPPCPLWVISGHRGQLNECPLYPQKRTSIERSERVRMREAMQLDPLHNV